jgi:hypothetical protein
VPKEEMISPPTNEKDLFNFDNKEEKRVSFVVLYFGFIYFFSQPLCKSSFFKDKQLRLFANMTGMV